MLHPPDRPSTLTAAGDNAVAFAIGVTADEWTLLILRYALRGARRYNDWRQVLPISHAVLTARLRRLEELGMLAAVEYQDRPRRLEYRLTPRGSAIWPVLVGIWAWESRWVEETEHLEAIRDVHCGHACQPMMTCAYCAAVIGARDVVGRFGPSGSWPRSVPNAKTRRLSHGAIHGDPGLLPNSMELIGNRWSAALLGAVFLGAHRFGEFQQRIGAPAAVVADRLRAFCARGVLYAAADERRLDRSTYHLTDKGAAFFPVIMSAIDWAQRWFHAPEGPALIFHHRGTGHGFAPVLVCDRCARPLTGPDVLVEPAIRATRTLPGTVLRT